MTKQTLFLGTAGWSIPRGVAEQFPAAGSQLERYAARMSCVEINTSFYRSHRPETYQRWAASTPAAFRFAVKCPKQITHERRLAGIDDLLAAFVSEAEGLGDKWAVLLVQLPPSLQFDADLAAAFFERTRAMFKGNVVCEPRHETWFGPEADALLRHAKVSRAAVDPSRWTGAAAPGGWIKASHYFRWHGSPRLYWSSYGHEWLRERADRLPTGNECWCIFDNTASGAALENALALGKLTSSI